MNHYPHHIGDFNNATRHLTFVERALYRELLDLYYDTEQPLNADASKLARRVLATTDEQRDALHVVLEEFFVLCDDGWHNDRCDREIAAFHGKQEQQSRAGLASAAKRAGRKPPASGGNAKATSAPRNGGGGSGSVGTDDQRPLNDRSTNQNQNQNQNHKEKEASPPKDAGDGEGAAAHQVVVLDPAAVPSSPAAWSVVFCDEYGVEVASGDINARRKFWPLATAWVKAGVTVGQMRAAVARARAEATEAIAYLPAYVDRVLASACSGMAHESRQEAAARARMQEAAPLAASRGPAPLQPADGEGYSFFERAAARMPALEVAQ